MRPLVVIPTYNESENIERMLRRIHECLPGAGVLVVDDGSPDGTAEIVKKVAAELPDINVLERASKSGLGSAYRAGFAWGLERGYDACIEIDADFSHDPAALPTLVAPLSEGFDVVIGSRYVEGGSIPNWAWHRHLLSRGGNLYASAVLGLGVSDSTAGYRCYSAGILRAMRTRQDPGRGLRLPDRDDLPGAPVRRLSSPRCPSSSSTARPASRRCPPSLWSRRWAW